MSTSQPTTMTAIRVSKFGGPEVLELKTIPIPKLSPNQVLIRLHAAGVNPVETYMRSGNYARLPTLPWTPGNDGAGVIVAVYRPPSSSRSSSRSSSPTPSLSSATKSTSPEQKNVSPSAPSTPSTSQNIKNVKNIKNTHPTPSSPPPSLSSASCIKIGSKVWLSGSVTGTYAQYCVCTTNQVHPLPDSIDSAQGAAIGVGYRTAYRALFIRAKVQAGDIVLIHGASGGVGIAAVQLAAAHGCIVYGTAGTEEGMKLILEQGCTKAFNHRNKGYMSKIYNSTTINNGVDVVLEMLANVNLNEDLKILTRGGKIAIIGNRGNVEINPRLLMQKESSIMGVLGGTEKEHQQCFAGIVAGLKSGALKPVVATPAYIMEQAYLAHECVIDDNQGSGGKVVLITK